MTDERLAKMRASLSLALDVDLPVDAVEEIRGVFAELQAYRAAKFEPARVYLYASDEWPKGVVPHEDYLAAVRGLQAQVKAERDRADAADKHRIEALREIAATAAQKCSTLRDRALDFLNAWDDDDELEGWSQRASQAAEALRRELR